MGVASEGVRKVSDAMSLWQLHIPSIPNAGFPGEECALLTSVPD